MTLILRSDAAGDVLSTVDLYNVLYKVSSTIVLTALAENGL